jgi:hypothetical protein
MRNMKSAFLSGLGTIALLLALTPDPVAAARGGGVRSGHFAARGAMATGGFRHAAVARPGWGGGVRPDWAGRRAMAGVAVARPGWGRPGWRGGWGGGWAWRLGVEAGAGPLRQASQPVSLRPILGAGVTVRDGMALPG